MTDYLQSRHMTDSILTGASSLGGLDETLISNIARGGQLGLGARIPKIDAATPIAFNPSIIIVTQAPTFWSRYPKKQEFLKALVETHAKSVTGIDFGYTLNTAENPFGHDSQQIATPTNTVRSAVAPSMVFPEVHGMLVYDFFKDWIWDIQNPDTNSSSLPAIMQSESDMPAWTSTAYSMSFVAIIPDPTGIPDRILDAAFYTNVVPREIGEVGFGRTIAQTETKDRTINFTGIVQHNHNTRHYGIAIMRMLNMHKVDYTHALPGLAGTTNPLDGGIDQELLATGGIYYETMGAESGVEGAVQQFVDLGETISTDKINGGGSIPATGASIPS